jgi:hypothetical protein
MLQTTSPGRITKACCFFVSYWYDRIGRFAEVKRCFTAKEAHFLSVFDMVTPSTLDAAYWKYSLRAYNRDVDGFYGRKNVFCCRGGFDVSIALINYLVTGFVHGRCLALVG